MLTLDRVRNVAVVGAGTMGTGIAQVFVAKGYGVILVDAAPSALERARTGILQGLSRWADKGVLRRDDVPAAMERLRSSPDLAAAATADFCVEAVPEDVGLKRDVFIRLDASAPVHAILASNTSSISITELAAATARPARVIGMHFMNPVPVMELVEVVRGHLTADETHSVTVGLAQALGKTPVTVADYPGFVSNRVLMPMINEAIACVMEGVASAEDVDKILCLGMRHPLGPLALADLVGLDVCLHILEVLQRDLGDPRYRPCALLRRMVAAGQLGRKTGRGFFAYGP